MTEQFVFSPTDISASYKSAKAIFADAHYVDDLDPLDQATHFELRPISVGRVFTCTSYFYGDDADAVEIRMGQIGKPAKLIAQYDGCNIAEACDAFFDLEGFGKPLWYDGNDFFALVSNKMDLVQMIAAHVMDYMADESDDVLEELYENTGLSDAEQVLVRAAACSSLEPTNAVVG